MAIASTTERIHERVADLAAAGIEASGHVGDLMESGAAARLVDEVLAAHDGRLDVLVNNAGMVAVGAGVSVASGVGVVVTVYKDRTFSFEVKSPPASVLLKDAVKAEKGSGEPNKNKIGKLTMAQCKALAKEKMKDLNAFDEDHAARILAGTARSMGITVEG